MLEETYVVDESGSPVIEGEDLVDYFNAGKFDTMFDARLYALEVVKHAPVTATIYKILVDLDTGQIITAEAMARYQ